MLVSGRIGQPLAANPHRFTAHLPNGL